MQPRTWILSAFTLSITLFFGIAAIANGSAKGGTYDETNAVQPAVEIEAATCTMDGTTVQVQGQMKNLSEQTIDWLQVEAFFHAFGQRFVSYHTGAVRIHPLLAGEMSPFAVSSPANLAIRTVELEVTPWLGSPLLITGKTLVECTRSS